MGSFSMAIACGLLTGFAVKFVDALGDNSAFLDSASWEVPELEIPFYFDRRGEINRDMLKAGAQGPAANQSNKPENQIKNGNKDAISNELLNTKLDLLLQVHE